MKFYDFHIIQQINHFFRIFRQFVRYFQGEIALFSFGTIALFSFGIIALRRMVCQNFSSTRRYTSRVGGRCVF